MNCAYVSEHQHEYTDRVVLNISGLRFETKESTLARFPDTLLGCKSKREKYYDYRTQEYFFGRSRQVFDAILFYYQSEGRLIRPLDVPEPLFINELRFFEIGKPETLLSFSEKVDRFILGIPLTLPKSKFKRIIWLTFNDPDTSRVAKLLAFWNIFTLIVSIGLACAETVPSWNLQASQTGFTYQVYYFVEVVCYVWFTLEYFVRLGCAYAIWPFVKNILNIIDLLAIIPFYLQIILEKSTAVTPLTLLRIIRAIRIVRLLKFSRYSRGMRALLFTLYESWPDLQLLGIIMVLVTTVSASLVYHAESRNEDSLLISIPESMWWAINTLTTVGYGDTYPSTGVGKFLGGLFSMLGTILLGLPIYCLVCNFLKLWESLRHQKFNDNFNQNAILAKNEEKSWEPIEEEDLTQMEAYRAANISLLKSAGE